tara:strand:- start:268 stop:2538 length:2271 start_codon:yes stop_codon:yes gene_type:complete
MASKYSNYELKPYVSTYTNPYSVEVNQVLRNRYDQNKAKVDLIDQTLGAKQTLEGDRIHVDNAKGMVKTRFENLTAIGDYENAGLAVSEVVNLLESDKGLQLAQKSWAIREKELEHIRTAKINGFNMLDFGLGKVNEHQSYYQDKEGAWVENVYEPLTEKEHSYSAHMQSLIKTIKADSSGVSQGKADRIARGLLPTYLDNYIGDQHYRNLTQIQGMSDQEAKATILQEIESITDQYVHHIQTKTDLKKNGELYKYLSKKGSSSDGSMSFSLKGDDVGNYLVKMNQDILNSDYNNLSPGQKSTSNRLARETFMVEKGALDGLLAAGDITKKEYDDHIKYGMNGFGTHYKLRNITNHYLSNEISSFEHTLQGDINHYTNVGVSFGTLATINMARKLRGKRTSVKAKGLILAGTFLGAEAYSYIDRGVTAQSNVRTAGNHFQQLFSGQSELEQLVENINDTEYLASRGVVHPETGEAYNIHDPEYKALVEVIKSNYSYRTQLGGDKVYGLIENYSGDIFTGNVRRPNDTKTGKEIRTILNSGDSRHNARNYNWLMLGEDGPGFDAAFFDDDGTAKKLQKTGAVAGSFEAGIPGYLEFQIDGADNVQYAEDKPSATGEDLTQVESMFMLMGDAESAAHTKAYGILTRMEKYSKGSGSTGGVTRHDQIEVLARAFEFVIDNYDGEMDLVDANVEGLLFAEKFMEHQFNSAHPGITLEIMSSLGYPDPEANIPDEIMEQGYSIWLERYNQYKELEIKRFND